MNLRPAPLVLALALALGQPVSAAPPAPANPLLEERLARIERIMENQSAAGIMLQLQQMQQETQELRGLVESQQFEIQKLQRQLRDQYLDIDNRLGAGKGPETPASDGSVVDASGPNPTAEPGTAAAGAIDASGTALQPPAGSVPEPATVIAPTPSSPRAVGIPALPTPETTSGNERDAYRDAFELLKKRDYAKAVDAFNAVLRQYPQGQFTDNARYWLAETYYVQRNYPAALAEFDRLVQLNPTSSKVPGAMLKIGYIQYEQEAWDQARAALKRLVERYPNSPEARLAQSRLQKLGQPSR